MSYLEEKRIYYVNSANRLSGTHSNFTYKFDIPYEKYDYVVCLDLSIPKSYYLIQADRNTFQLTENSTSTTITVPAGNYSSSTFSKYVSAEMTTKSPNHWTYTISQNNQGKFNFSVTGNSNSQPSITVKNALYEQLGFEPNTTNNFTDNTLTSTNTVDFQRESTLFLRSDIIGTGSGDSVLQQVFAENTTDFSNITYKCEDVQAFAKKLVSQSGSTYNFYLTNENGEQIDTNGRNMVFTLMLFKKSTANENLNSFIKYTAKFLDDFRYKRF